MALPLQSHLPEIAQRLSASPLWWLGLDFDGTLVDIAPTPAGVVFRDATRDLLDRLSQFPHLSVAIISGRELSDVRSRVGLEQLAYSGNHGLQIEGPGLAYENHMAAELQGLIEAMAERIATELAEVEPALVENKRLSLSVHYRLVPEDQWSTVRRVVEEAVGVKSPFRIKPGARVWEVRPAIPASKGTAAAWLRQQHGATSLPIFLGDDVTDEDAFEALTDGITIHVGKPRPTFAAYQVDTTDDVHAFLKWLADQAAEMADGPTSASG